MKMVDEGINEVNDEKKKKKKSVLDMYMDLTISMPKYVLLITLPSQG